MKIIRPETARQGESRPQTESEPAPTVPSDRPVKKKRPAKSKPSSTIGKVTARDRAKTIAQDQYDVNLAERRPMSAAERRAKRRREYVAVSFELPPETAAKLFALAERSGSTQTGIVRQLIDAARLPSES